jgi:hypothetical protein
MRYEARVTAYDLLGDILVSVVVQRTPDSAEVASERALATSVQFRGRGTTEATEWLREALEGLLRVL